MAVDKNFVVKNGLEVDTNLIFADANRNQVGIATTVTNFTFQVNGGVGATNITISNLSTVLSHFRVGTSGSSFTVLSPSNFVGIRTATPIFPLDIRSSVSTGQTSLYVAGDVKITGLVNAESVNFNSAILSSLSINDSLTVNSPAVTQLNGYVDINNSADISGNLNLTGISTLGGYVDINNSVDISNNLNVSGIITASTFVGQLNSSGVSTVSNIRSTNINATGIITASTFIGNLNSSGVSTVSNLRSTNINATGIVTASSVSIGITEVISSTRQLKNIVSLDSITTDLIESVIANAPNTFTDMSVSGISTFGRVLVSSGVITATSGVVTYFGDGAYLNNTLRGIGIATLAGLVGYGVSFINFAGPLISTCFLSPNTGIATIYFENVGPTIGIGTTPGQAGFFGEPGVGNIWYNTNYGRLFLYYSDGDTSQWVDASPSNVGIITSLTNISFYRGSASSPSVYIVDDEQTGVFSPGANEITFVSAGSSILNINNNGIRVTGVSTFNNTVVGGSTTALVVNGDVIVTGVSTFTNTINSNRITETVVNGFTTSLSPSTGTLTIDTSLGTVFLGDLSASVTTWAFTNVPTANSKATTITVIIDGDTAETYGDACTVNGSAVSGGIKWNGGSTPTATNNYDIITFSIVRDNFGTVIVFGSSDMNYS